MFVNHHFVSTLFLFSIDGFEQTSTKINDDQVMEQNVPICNEEKGPVTDTSVGQSNNDNTGYDKQNVLSTTTSDLNTGEDVDMQDLRKLDDAKHASVENCGMFKRLQFGAVLNWMLNYQ